MAAHGKGKAGTSFRDVLQQASWAVRGRRVRSLLTAAGVGLGIAATVATVGLTGSAASAISDRFSAVQATQVTMRYPDQAARPDPLAVVPARSLHGVSGAGLVCQAAVDKYKINSVAPQVNNQKASGVTLVAAEPEAMNALGAAVRTGRMYDSGHGTRRAPVAVVDLIAARELGVVGDRGQVIYVNGQPITVVGVFEAPPGVPLLTAAIVVPYEICLDDWSGQARDDRTFESVSVVLRTQLGAADQVAEEARVVLMPTDPDALTAVVPPDLRSFRRGVEGDTRGLYLGLALVSLVIGALGVSNTTLVSVLERRAEIGLRRAIGASKAAIAGQFLIESALLGLVGGLGGTVVGLNVTAGVALAKGWLVVLDPAFVAAGPFAGVVVGTLAGAYPAWAASRLAPAATVRG